MDLFVLNERAFEEVEFFELAGDEGGRERRHRSRIGTWKCGRCGS